MKYAEMNVLIPSSSGLFFKFAYVMNKTRGRCLNPFFIRSFLQIWFFWEFPFQTKS